MCSIWCPFNAYSAIWFSFSVFNVSIKVPDINFTCKVSEATNNSSVLEGVYSDCVSVSLAKFKLWIGEFVIQSSYCWLSTRDHNEIVSKCWPFYIMNHCIKYRYEYSGFSSNQLNKLETVLTIVVFTSRINIVLRPYKYGLSSWWWSDVNFLSFAALYKEFGLINCWVQIEEVDISSCFSQVFT